MGKEWHTLRYDSRGCGQETMIYAHLPSVYHSVTGPLF